MHNFFRRKLIEQTILKTILSNDAQQVTASRYPLTFYHICRLEENNFTRWYAGFVIEHRHFLTHQNFPRTN